MLQLPVHKKKKKINREHVIEELFIKYTGFTSDTVGSGRTRCTVVVLISVPVNGDSHFPRLRLFKLLQVIRTRKWGGSTLGSLKRDEPRLPGPGGEVEVQWPSLPPPRGSLWSQSGFLIEQYMISTVMPSETVLNVNIIIKKKCLFSMIFLWYCRGSVTRECTWCYDNWRRCDPRGGQTESEAARPECGGKPTDPNLSTLTTLLPISFHSLSLFRPPPINLAILCSIIKTRMMRLRYSGSGGVQGS